MEARKARNALLGLLAFEVKLWSSLCTKLAVIVKLVHSLSAAGSFVSLGRLCSECSSLLSCQSVGHNPSADYFDWCLSYKPLVLANDTSVSYAVAKPGASCYSVCMQLWIACIKHR